MSFLFSSLKNLLPQRLEKKKTFWIRISESGFYLFAGETYIFLKKTPTDVQDWSNDGHNWIKEHTIIYPENNPTFKMCSYCIQDKDNDDSSLFRKNVCTPLCNDKIAIVHYTRDDSLHRSRSSERCPATRKNGRSQSRNKKPTSKKNDRDRSRSQTRSPTKKNNKACASKPYMVGTAIVMKNGSNDVDEYQRMGDKPCTPRNTIKTPHEHIRGTNVLQLSLCP